MELVDVGLRPRSISFRTQSRSCSASRSAGEVTQVFLKQSYIARSAQHILSTETHMLTKTHQSQSAMAFGVLPSMFICILMKFCQK